MDTVLPISTTSSTEEELREGARPILHLHELFEARVASHPEALALVSEEGRLTYQELEARANQVARALQGLGVGPEVPVGLCTGRTLEMFVGLLGILKAGGAYVPLDPAYPRQRLAYILEDARVTVVLTHSAVEPALPESPARRLRLDSDPVLPTLPATRPVCRAGPDNLAYILFTSGSTGRPKGVLIEHRGIAQLAEALVRALDLGPPTRVLQYTSLNFDLSVSEMIMAWTTGGSLHLVPQGALVPGPALLGLLRTQVITHAVLPPSLLAVLPPDGLSHLQMLLSGGEACTAPVVARWSPGRRLVNAYGPTEATVYATVYECSARGPRADRPPPIGRPLAGATVHVLDAALRPVPDGEVGELFLGGVGVARGYLGRPELTAQRFVPHPVTGERLYRTGDDVRLLPEGDLEFLGRKDEQLKIRGYRVEPGEVEAVLARHPAVRAVTVVGREDTAGEKRLVAYLVVAPEQSPGPSGWRQLARQALPEYMVPAAFVELPSLPVSPSGKVDRRALPPPGRERPVLAAPFRAPETPLQRALESLWSQVLGVAPVGLEDPFLELGGDSLRATALALLIRESLGVEVPPLEVLQARTLERLAERVEASRERGQELPPLLPAPRPSALPLSFAQQRLWFLHRIDPGADPYNIPLILRLTGPLDVPTLARALGALVERHESLRTTFPVTASGPIQRIAPPGPVLLPITDLGDVPEDRREEQLAALTREVLARPFDLEEGPLLRAHLVVLGATEHALLLAIHHTVCDGASLEVLNRDLTSLYEGLLAGDASPLPALPVQYADYTLWQQQWLKGERLERGLSFWRRTLEGAPRSLELPADRPRPSGPTTRGAMLCLRIPAATTQALDTLARAEGATLFMALQGALGALLHRCTGSEDLIVGAPVAGRNRRELEGLIGFFVNTLALRIQLHGDPGFRELLARVRAHTLECYAHQDVPFEKLVEALRPDRAAGHQPLFQVMLALQRPPPEAVTRGGLRVRLSETDIGVAPFELTWNFWESAGGLEGTLLYNTDLFEAETAERLVADFQALLEEATAAPDRPLSRLERPGRWGLPTELRPSEVEAALLADASVETCAVRFRRLPGSRPLCVAYVVPSGNRPPGGFRMPTLPAHLRPELLVPVDALPLTSAGTVDEDALQRLPILDESLARQWEEQLQQRPELHAVEVHLTPAPRRREHLHLARLLPGFRLGRPQETQAPAQPSRATPVRESSGAVAFSDGGPLELPDGAPRTLVEALLQVAASSQTGLTYVGPDGTVQRQRYSELLHEARCALTGLRARGLRAGDRAILQIDSLRDLCTAFWACLLGGITPVVVAVAPTYETRNAVVGKLHGAWELLDRPHIIASMRLLEPIQGLVRLLPISGLELVPVEAIRDFPPAEHLHPAKPEDVAFLQLSSGSTGIPKCVQIRHTGVAHHSHAVARVNGYGPRDVCLNWLPFDHVGPLLMYHVRCTYLGLEQVQVATEWILADPLRWLDLIEAHGVTFTWSPNFGYKLVSDALRRPPGRTWRLEHVRRFFNGGEQVTLPVIRAFLEDVRPFGVQPLVMQAGYGMAELCTVVTHREDVTAESGAFHVLNSSLGTVLELQDTESASTVSFIDVGTPSPGVQLRIVDAENQLLPEGVIGRVQARGAVVTPGYVRGVNAQSFVGDGWFDTGDSGFLLRGHLAITGRQKEMIIVRGTHLYCHDIEDRVCSVEGVELAATCGVDAPSQGTEGFAVFFVPREGGLETQARLATEIRTRVTASFGAAPTYVIPLSREEFPRTTSGKIQRTALKEALAVGRFSAILEALDLQQGNDNTLPAWFHRRVWRPLAPGALAPAREGTSLLFVDSRSLGARLAEVLNPTSGRCVRVEPGTGSERLGPDAFRIRPDDPEAYDWLLSSVSSEDTPLAQVVHLWTVDGAPHEASAETRRQGAWSLLLLAQALARSPRGGQPLRLHVVSRQAQPTTPGEPIDCDKALLLGLTQTLPQELPWLDVRHLDLSDGAPEDLLSHVLRELRTVRREREVAYRGGQRLVPRLEQVDPGAGERRPLPFRDGGTYLLTGGLGTLGVELAGRLLETYRARLLLIGRTSLSAPEAGERKRAYDELERLAARTGGQVHYEAVDVCEVEALRRAVAEAETRWSRPLDGVLHLAGAIVEQVLTEETLEHFASVLRPKVEGTLALERMLEDRPAAFLIGFSSLNSAFGGFSVGAYSAANRFLEHILHTRRGTTAARRDCLAWSRWRGLGPARTEEQERLASARGYQAISPTRGWMSLLAALTQGTRELLIGLDPDAPQVRARTEPAVPRGLQLTAFHTGPPGREPTLEALPEVRDRFGTPVPRVIQRVEQLPRDGGRVDLEALTSQAPGRNGPTLERVPPQDEVERTVAAVWKEHLQVEELGVLDNFFELGGHSILLAQVQHRLEQLFHRRLSGLEMFRYPTVRALAQYLAGSDQAPAESSAIDERAQKQRAARGRHRLRRSNEHRKDSDEQ